MSGINKIDFLHADEYADVDDSAASNNSGLLGLLGLLTAPKISDKLRAYSGKYYATVNGQIKRLEELAPFKFFEKLEFFVGTDNRLGVLVYPNKESATFKTNNDYNPEKFREFMASKVFDETSTYSSLGFTITAPGDREKEESYPSADVVASYDWYERAYEDTHLVGSYEEAALPNAYVFGMVERQAEQGTSLDYLVTYVDNNYYDQRRLCLAEMQNGQYFRNFAKRYLAARENAFLQKISDVQKKYVFSLQGTEEARNHEDVVQQFPMHITVDFDTPPSRFANDLEETNFADFILNEMVNSSRWSVETQYVRQPSEVDFTPTALRRLDLKAWWDAYIKQGPPVSPRDNEYVYFGQMRLRQAGSLEGVINQLVLDQRFRALIDENRVSSLEDVYAGIIPAYNETLAYKVEKLEFSTGKVLQTYYFSNSNKREALRYIDTQILYGKEYTYRISAIQLAIGSKYRFTEMVEEKSFPSVEFGTQTSRSGLVSNSSDVDKYWRLLSDKGLIRRQRYNAYEFVPVIAEGIASAKENNYTLVYSVDTLKVYLVTNSVADILFETSLIKDENVSKFLEGIQYAVKEDGTKIPVKSSSVEEFLYNSFYFPALYFNESLENFSVATQQAVAGFSYVQTQASVESYDYTNWMRMFYEIEPTVELYEIPVFSKSCAVYDLPPCAPEVSFIQRLGVSDSVRFALNRAVDDYRTEPIEILPTDYGDVERLLAHQRSKDGKLRFGGDDEAMIFQMFRLESEPKVWKDFAKAKQERIHAGDIIDSVEANKAYYYTFRAFDSHKHYSNPSSIFKVIVHDDGGVVYTSVEIYEIKEKRRGKVSKTFKHYLSIDPAYLQTLIKTNENGVYAGVGVEDFSVWDKTFRVRVTSKNTGRVLDIYVKFTLDDKLVIGKVLASR